MTEERNVAATVIDQEGNEVKVRHRGEELYATMQGFPPGFELRPGERVILRDEAKGGLTARPLVRAIRSPVRQDALGPNRPIEVDDGTEPYLMAENAVLTDPAPGEWERASPDHGILWVVDPGSAKGPQRVIAARVRR